MKLPGHMGQDKVTVRNLKVLRVDPEKNLLVLNGAVPGGKNAMVLIRSRNPEFEKRLVVPTAPAKASEEKPAVGATAT